MGEAALHFETKGAGAYHSFYTHCESPEVKAGAVSYGPNHLLRDPEAKVGIY